MVLRSLLLALACCAWGLPGCSIIDERVRDAYLHQWPLSDGSLSFSIHGSDEQPVRRMGLDDVRRDIFGMHATGRAMVHHPRGLSKLARDIAERLDESLRLVERQMGLKIPFGFEIYLIRAPEHYRENIEVELPIVNDRLATAVFVLGDAADANDVLAGRPGMLYILIHEAVEFTLIHPAHPTKMLPDARINLVGIPYEWYNGTRWARDGLANYAGCIALNGETARITTLGPHDEAMAKLATTGADQLLNWRQYSDENHYDAALGLFLLIEERYGREAIRTFLQRLAERDGADGKELETLLSEVIGEDLRRVIQSVPASKQPLTAE